MNLISISHPFGNVFWAAEIKEAGFFFFELGVEDGV